MLSLLIGDLFIPDRAVDIPSKFRKLLSPNAPAVPSNAKISQVLCLGNITQSTSTLRFLHDLSPFFSAVRGEFDDVNLVSQQLALLDAKNDSTLPLYRVVKADNFRIGFTSGHQIVPRNDPLLLLAFAREIDVDILVWGGTHRVEAYTLDGKFFISPGSATGAYSMNWPDLDEEEDEYSLDGNEEANADKTSASNAVDQDETNFDSSHLSSSLPSFCLLDTHTSRCTLYIYTYGNDEVKVDKVLYLKD
ncbi:hypothetical protein METBIDRAFT_46444 [Metschnikowia bicuspidata var. bicuspidata NRRL YB-4993]|uniref:Vacuolar protein sorting-associated protein 29 n=1 Tax=Metschnikowia bicuspidata var. bicuspidata NRRL YB-4993 TaxID=869754 RepID=A0A1A0H5A3_9ASCO|nr:hypothetical protein METBIDRAFT_46444 [Metschnikowia bicuspidata var. bicuspidata NRRL YB-4993]OBA19130.1 hypothetical protein METBIDRAFT_46444 [Metschnikowia bicuspidata var. bicuspidata NRRL YB-4993]